MKNIYSGAKFPKLVSIILTLSLFMQFAVFLPIPAEAATITTWSDSFGTGSDLNDIPNWEEQGDEIDSTTLAKSPGTNDDTASPDGDRFAKIMSGEWVCTQLNANDLDNLFVKYYWRGDGDAEDGEIGIVEYRANGTCTSGGSGWATLVSYELDNNNTGNTEWSSLQTVNLPSSLDNDNSFSVRFKNNSDDGNDNNEFFRIDGFSFGGNEITDKINICHATNSPSNPWEAIRINESAWDGGPKHSQHGDFSFAGPVDTQNQQPLKPEGDIWCEDNAVGTLTVIKRVINDNGGTAVATNFIMDVQDDSGPIADFPGSETGTTITIPVTDSYSAGESGEPDGYDISFEGDCSGSIAVGETKTCTITNNDIAPALTLDKVVSGGSAVAFNWQLNAVPQNLLPSNGISGLGLATSDDTFQAGTYELSEIPDDVVITANYTASEWVCEGDGIQNGNTITLDIGEAAACSITNTYTPPELATGSIEITKYACSEGTTVVRSANGVGGAVPAGCDLQAGATFGYVHGTQTDANGPYPELSAPITAGGSTGANGVLTISNLPSAGRYLVVETDGSNNKRPAGDILGLYCIGDGDTSNNNDNQELTFVPAGGTVKCVAYNKSEEVPPREPPQNSCTLPNEEGGTLATFGVSPEKTLQQILTDTGYGLNVNTDQTTHEVWDGAGSNVTLEFTKLDGISANPLVFGYYLNDGSPETFVPLFESGDHPDFNLPYTAPISVTIPSADLISFAINTYDTGVAKVYSTDPADNSFDGANDHAAVYNPLTNEYAVAFEDIALDSADKDYNDVVVKIKMTCENPAVCNPQVNLITNGDFELPDVTDNAMWQVFNSGTSGLAWIVDWVNPTGAPIPASLELHEGVNGWLDNGNGDQYAELDGDWGGPSSSQSGESASTQISQNIQTIPGKNYKLTFDFSPRPNRDATENILGVFWDGAEISGSPVSAAGNGTQTDWKSYEFNLPASDALTTLMFKDKGISNSEGTFIDNVSLTCQNEEVCTKTNVEQTIVSDATTQQNSHDSVLVDQPYHQAWTTAIPGATWIWGENLASIDLTVDRIEVFTKTFTISGVPTGATLDLATDNGYIVKINGVVLPDGDQFSQEHNYETPNIDHFVIPAGMLSTGMNVLEVTIKNFAMDGGNVAINPAGLLYKLVITEDQCQVPPVCSATNVEQNVVSDTSNIVNTTAFAAETYTHPVWTSLSGAKWIWDTALVTDPSVDQTNVFTKTFVVTGSVLSAGIDIASDNGYLLKVNGITVEDKLAVENNFSAITHYDLFGKVQSGSNTLEITVKNNAYSTQDPQANPAGLLYKLTVNRNECSGSGGNNGGEEPGTSRVHIVKFVDNQKATANSAKNQSFKIDVAGQWTGDLSLNSVNSYESDIDKDYTNESNSIDIQEDTTDSNVISFGSQCSNDKFKVVGYTSGNSLSEALNSSASSTDKAFLTNIKQDTYVVVWNEACPNLSTVKICKVDQAQAPLPNWTMMLKSQLAQDNLSVPVNTSAGIDSNALVAGASYIAESTGTWLNQNGANPVDTEYSTTDAWATHMDGYTNYQSDILELQINSAFDPNSNWGAYNGAHKYAQSFIPGTDGPANFRIFDGTGTTQNEDWFGDNSGSLNVDIFEGYAGITSQDGCVTFADVPFGTYNIDEILQNGWSNVSGLGEAVVNEGTETFTVQNTNSQEPPIVCGEGFSLVGTQCTPLPPNPSGNDPEEDGLGGDYEGAIRLSSGGGGGGGIGGRRHDISALLGMGDGRFGEVLGAATCELYLNKYIKFGADNDPEEVKKLQIFLNQFFELNNPVTGVYGPITHGMVNKFQVHQKDAILVPWTIAGYPTDGPTGYVYKTTKRWINILKCPELIATSPIPFPLVPESLSLASN